MIQGEMLKSGNRLFNLDITDNNQIIFKLNKTTHIKLNLPELRNNYKRELYKLEELNDIKQGVIGYTYSVKLDKKHIYISYESFKNEEVKVLNVERYIGIDLNPNEIVLSIKEGDKILEVRKYVLNIKENDSNKIKHELFEICKKIANLFKSYNCKYIFVEDLTIKSKDHKKGKTFNRNVNNRWIRTDFINNLEKRISIISGKLFKINPAYSSFIGNRKYDL